MEIFEDSELEEKHLEAIQATGISDAGKGRKVQNGTIVNSEKVLELAYEEGVIKRFTRSSNGSPSDGLSEYPTENGY